MRDFEEMEVDGRSVDGNGVDQERGERRGEEKASGNTGESWLEKAKKGMRTLKEKLKGKILFRSSRDGSVRVSEEGGKRKEEEEAIGLEELVEEGEEVIVTEEEKKAVEKEKGSTGSVSSGTGTIGYGFLEDLDFGEKEEEKDITPKENRKRKMEEVKPKIMFRGLKVSPGWADRAEKSRDDSRWKRRVEEKVDGKKVGRLEKIPLPEEFDLGLDRRGIEMNSAARKNNNFGMGKAVFEKAGGGKGEDKNWISSFTRGGCVGCKDREGKSTHTGRTGEPVVLIMGDEATPSVVGFTKEGEGSACCWVFKKEHMALQEVAQILRKLNTEKKEWDRSCGRRTHEFFIPNGSKIIVGSYTHLRREGLEGYISDFNNMVKDVWAVTGDVGIEVLPYVPVVYPGIDEMGGELLAGVQDWVEWIGHQKGRESISELAGTGGAEYKWSDMSRIIYRPAFMSLTSKDCKDSAERSWKNKGNRLDWVRGERKEVSVRHLAPSRELGKMLSEKGVEEEQDGAEQERRSSFEKGVSVEAEFVFVKAVGEFTRKAVKEGSYTGGVVKNVKEQLSRRAQIEEKGSTKKYVVVIGASEMGRIGDEIDEIGGEVVSTWKSYTIKGEWTGEKVEEIKRAVSRCEIDPDVIIVGGPSNSLIRHGPQSRRGFGPEKRTIYTEGEGGGRIEQGYHLTEPVKVTLAERARLCRWTVELVEHCKREHQTARVAYLGLFPRFLTKCCSDSQHMSQDDVWLMHNVRREFDMEVGSKLSGKGEVIKWHEALGRDKEPEMNEIREWGVVGGDGVHLGNICRRNAAVNLCYRLLEDEIVLVREDNHKRMRL